MNTTTATTPTIGRPTMSATWTGFLNHRGYMVELQRSGQWLARDPWTATVMTEASGMVGRYSTAEAACSAIDRKLSRC